MYFRVNFDFGFAIIQKHMDLLSLPREQSKQSEWRMFRNSYKACGKIKFVRLSPLSLSTVLKLDG